MRRLISPGTIALLIALTVFGAVSAVQRVGALQSSELAAYDFMLQRRHDPKAADPRITLIAITEEDVRARDYPLHDSELATALDSILDADPAAVGLDIYRDLPEPRDGSEIARLNEVLSSERARKLIAIFMLPDGGEPGAGPPPIFANDPDHVGFNDFPADEGVVRRAILLQASPGETYLHSSFALGVAETYLASRNGVNSESATFTPSEDLQTARLGHGILKRFNGNDGGYKNAEATGFQILLDFKSPDAFTTYSMDDVIHGRVPLADIHDHVLLIGDFSRSHQDFHKTPVNSQYSGAKLHAQIVNQLLRAALDGEPATSSLPSWGKSGWAFFWAALGGLSGLALLRSPMWAPAALISGGVLLLLSDWLAFQHGWWLPPVEPALDYSFTAFFTIGLVHLWERRQRAELMQLFSRHVSGKVARNIWLERETFLDGKRPQPRKLTATVLFTDFVGFSGASERIGDPAKLLDWLNEGMQQLARRVEEHDGIVNKYIGDGIMAVFGVPIPRASEEEFARDAVNAVRCALSMKATLEKLNARWREKGMEETRMRIGIFTGPLVAGTLGSEERLEFTVIGDTVNTASRLESTAKDGPNQIPAPPGSCCRILIGEPTHRLIQERFETEWVGDLPLEGKANSAAVYSVLREIDSSNPMPTAVTIPASSP